MFTVLSCIFTQHDLRLVALAAVICSLSAIVAFALDRRRQQARAEKRAAWTILTGVLAAAGVWSTHFIAMLAYATETPIRFHLGGTVASFFVAAIGMAAGFGLAANWKHRASPIAGGALAGLGIAGMHYLGVAAVATAFDLQWKAGFVAASLIIAMTGGAAAFVAGRLEKDRKQRIFAPLLLVVAIVGLHFTAMAALTLIPDLTVATSPQLIGTSALAVMVSVVVIMIFGAAFGLMALERHSRKESLRGIESIFEGITAGLALFDRDNRLVLWNHTYAELLGHYGLDFHPGLERAAIITAVAGARAADARLKQDRVDEWALPDGRWINVSSKALPNGDSVAVLTDVTALKNTAVAMAEARDRAEAANRAKSQFLANMSHEIRTPLNGVLGMVQVMEAGVLDAEQRERLGVIKQSGGGLLVILNDLLDLAKIESGRMEISPEDFDLVALARTTCALYEGAASQKALKLACNLEAGIEGLWRGDGPRVRQALTNLVDNAVKFTASGSVTVKVSTLEVGVCLSVTDTGAGVDTTDISRLFEKFSQADGAETRIHGGAGLGLSITKELAELMGGRIEVESVLGGGSTFRMILPLAQSLAGMPAPAATTAPSAHPALRILAAEDNKTNQLVLRSLLEPVEASLTIVGDGAQAVAAFRDGDFDIILMDIQMPEMNGVEAALAIRALEAQRGRTRTPIIAVTANVMPHQIGAYTDAGMDMALSKPIEVGKLYAALDAAAGGKALRVAA